MDQERPPEKGRTGAHSAGPAGAVSRWWKQLSSAKDGSTRWWAGKPILLSVTALAAMAVLTLATIAQSPSATAGADASNGDAADTATTATTATSAPAPTTPTPAPTTTTPSPPASPTAPSDGVSVAQALEKATGGSDGNVSVAVADLDGTDSATYDSDSDDVLYDTASIVKVDILATLLLQHQDAGTQLTSSERSLATEMIENSDNTAATDLWDAIGESPGLNEANKSLGLTDTSGGTDGDWGLTQTSAADQLALLRDVFGDDDSPLSSASRTYIQGLMGEVEADQRWGVSAADSDDSGFALKNGWLQRSATELWDINSIGMVTYEGHELLISVLSSGQPTETTGIDLVETAAAAAAGAFTDGSA
jgi:beta-lactamase class A